MKQRQTKNSITSVAELVCGKVLMHNKHMLSWISAKMIGDWPQVYLSKKSKRVQLGI